MRGILGGTNARTNEEYREVIKGRMRIMMLLVILGIISASLGYAGEFYFDTSIDSHMLGVYSGMGVGLIAAGAALWIKNKLILNNEEKLKASRISNTDERIKEIGNNAFRAASIAMLVAVYIMALVGGLYNILIFKVLIVIPYIFLLIYVASYWYYNKKM
jgi:hypothetical protein